MVFFACNDNHPYEAPLVGRMSWRVIAVAVMLVPVVSGAAYIKFDGVDGEATDADHKDEIDVLAWSWGVQRTRGDVVLGDVVVVRELDKSSTKLVEGVQSGGSVGDITLRTEVGREYLVIHMEEAIVSSYQIKTSSDDRPTEEVSFYYNKISWTYQSTGADGRVSDRTITFSGLE